MLLGGIFTHFFACILEKSWSSFVLFCDFDRFSTAKKLDMYRVNKYVYAALRSTDISTVGLSERAGVIFLLCWKKVGVLSVLFCGFDRFFTAKNLDMYRVKKYLYFALRSVDPPTVGLSEGAGASFSKGLPYP